MSDEQQWEIHTTITPTADGKYAQICLDIRKPSSRVPQYINSTIPTDVLFPHTQGEFNNALRRVVNEIVETVVKPNKLNNRR